MSIPIVYKSVDEDSIVLDIDKDWKGASLKSTMNFFSLYSTVDCEVKFNDLSDKSKFFVKNMTYTYFVPLKCVFVRSVNGDVGKFYVWAERLIV